MFKERLAYYGLVLGPGFPVCGVLIVHISWISDFVLCQQKGVKAGKLGGWCETLGNLSVNGSSLEQSPPPRFTCVDDGWPGFHIHSCRCLSRLEQPHQSLSGEDTRCFADLETQAQQ